MGKEDSNKELNEFEKQLDEIKEWQKNAYNPGYFIGSGRVPLPLKNLSKTHRFPIMLLIAGIIMIIPAICSFIKYSITDNIITNLMEIVIGGILIIGGITRIIELPAGSLKSKKKQKAELGREKDIKDIKLIDKHIKKKNR